METVLPFATINQLQISLRKGSNIPSYDPTDVSLPDFPSVEDSISRLDPSPPYLRCKHCKGRLLRGINSLFCVFCSREQWIESPPDPINFRSITGYKWLLDSLQLDGSEVVELVSEGNESSRGHNNTPKELPLSDLLNLEIGWHPKSEQPRTNGTEVPFLNLAGVDLDDFFVEAKTEDNLNEPEEQLGTKDKNRILDSNADDWFQDDPRSNSSSGITGTNPSTNTDWFRNDQWQTSSKNPRTTDDNDDSLDAWDDFASSVNIKDRGMPSSTQTSGIDLFSISTQEKDGGGLQQQQPDLFSGAFQSQIDRSSPRTEVEMLISQMHDLSFMLDSDLSIPRPTEKPDFSLD